MRILAIALIVVAGAAGWTRNRWTAVTITGDSMVPAFASGDRVLVHRISLRRLTVGDVVVARLPGLPPADELGARDRPWLVKRVAALPGDPIPVPVPTAADRVPPGHLVLLSDNTEGSVDSRDFGCVDADLVLGRVARRLSADQRPDPEPA